tara:strand:+ start:279 stop:1454 length:1176 start_codon:yes stop_codon:yes gene_type:complete
MEPTNITTEICENLWKEHLEKKDKGFVAEQKLDVQSEVFLDILDKNASFDGVSEDWKIKTPDIFQKVFPILENLKKIDKIALSISGGVDSMLMSKLLKIYCSQHNIKLILIHINYNNRECCEREEKFLNWWVQNYIHCDLYIHRFTNICRSRNSKERARYEDITRRIRFSFYEYFDCPIVLGHNLDDCYENIFSNLSKRIHFDNLFGMSEISVESDITIVRPLLNTTKIEILEEADILKLPYLEDSTPAWSNRGQMRDTLLPHIRNFNPHILTGLKEFVQHTTKLETQWNTSFKSWIKNEIVSHDIDKHVEYIINVNHSFFKENYEDLNFWVNIWFHYDIPKRPSNKSIKSCIEFIKKNKSGTKFQLNTLATIENIPRNETIKFTVCNNHF